MKCGRCLKNLPQVAFHRNQKWCRDCKKGYDSARHRRKKYGIADDSEYANRLTAQGSVCGLCHHPFGVGGLRPVVDHDHETGRVRGILHNICNANLVAGLELVSRLVNAPQSVVAGSALQYLSTT